MDTALPLEQKPLTLPRRARHRLGKLIGNHAPSAFFFMADRAGREGSRIKGKGDVIDIMRGDQIVRIATSNAVYAPLIAESFAYFFDSVDPVLARVNGRTVSLVDFSTPRLHRMRGFEDFPILCPSLSEPFATAQQYLDFAHLEPGQVALDLGAYSGLTSILFAKAVGPSGRVVAVEPDPINIATFRINRDMSGLSNISLVDAAIASTNGQLKLSSEGTMGSAFVAFVGTHRGVIVEVEALTLDTLAKRERLEHVDFVKMDIEGAEASVVPASKAFFERYRPRVIMEPHPINGVSTAPTLKACLESIGYQCELIEQHGLHSLPLLTAAP